MFNFFRKNKKKEDTISRLERTVSLFEEKFILMRHTAKADIFNEVCFKVSAIYRLQRIFLDNKYTNLEELQSSEDYIHLVKIIENSWKSTKADFMNEDNVWMCQKYSTRMITEIHDVLYTHKLLTIIIQSIYKSNKHKEKAFQLTALEELLQATRDVLDEIWLDIGCTIDTVLTKSEESLIEGICMYTEIKRQFMYHNVEIIKEIPNIIPKDDLSKVSLRIAEISARSFVVNVMLSVPEMNVDVLQRSITLNFIEDTVTEYTRSDVLSSIVLLCV